MGKQNRTVVDEIVASLCRSIFRGEHKPGDNLPPLRQMASEYGVTLPTMQRVVARMEELGVVYARQGSGVKVLEPLHHAAPAAMVFWLDVLQDRPGEAMEFVASFVQVRRELAVSYLCELREAGVSKVEAERMLKDVEHFEQRVEEGVSLDEAMELDFGVMRGWLGLRPKVAVFVILNMFEQLVSSTQVMKEAVYDHPERNVLGYRAVYDAFMDRGLKQEVFKREVTGLLATFDMISLARFEAMLGTRKCDV